MTTTSKLSNKELILKVLGPSKQVVISLLGKHFNVKKKTIQDEIEVIEIEDIDVTESEDIDAVELEEIDVDELSESVKEAVSLIKICKSKIEKAELEVKKVVDGFDG